MKNRPKRKNSFVRFLKQILIGALLGGVLGFVAGFLSESSLLSNSSAVISAEKVAVGIHVVSRFLVLVLIILSLMVIAYIRKYLPHYQKDMSDDSEELYRSLNRKYSYGIIFTGVASVLTMLNILLMLSFKSTQPFLDFAVLILVIMLQAYLLKLYGRIKGVKVPLFPNLKELKSNILQMDEAELEAEHQNAFEIVMNLSGAILPSIYVILFFIVLLTGRVELTAMLVAAFIHLYIMLMQFKITKAYYR
ncbi:DUF3169 family protein [Streptococcus ferus]|uniref:Membrane protein n=1 Tax=Streptococcus ferus TaxID=1345 RepID=A0A2X3W5A6_9STRE|nr:DUF3169 family protein [Streptococcus ferus]SQF40727.1 membrane protein [Streptococcus ferus]